jgi:hypothetical protein
MTIRILLALGFLTLLPACASQYDGQNMHNDAQNNRATAPPQSITPPAVVV